MLKEDFQTTLVLYPPCHTYFCCCEEGSPFLRNNAVPGNASRCENCLPIVVKHFRHLAVFSLLVAFLLLQTAIGLNITRVAVLPKLEAGEARRLAGRYYVPETT